MQFEKIMEKLESMGTYQQRKAMIKEGVTAEMFGVNLADIGRLSKRIKRNTHIAQKLWETENHDARMLATKVILSADLDRETIEKWIDEVDNHYLAAAVADMISETCYSFELMQEWIGQNKGWKTAVAWAILTKLAAQPGNFGDSFYAAYMEDIRNNIGNVIDPIKLTMNNALIAMGSRNYELKELAVGIANEIGPLKVVFGENEVKLADAKEYIGRTWERKERGKL